MREARYCYIGSNSDNRYSFFLSSFFQQTLAEGLLFAGLSYQTGDVGSETCAHGLVQEMSRR